MNISTSCLNILKVTYLIYLNSVFIYLAIAPSFHKYADCGSCAVTSHYNPALIESIIHSIFYYHTFILIFLSLHLSQTWIFILFVISVHCSRFLYVHLSNSNLNFYVAQFEAIFHLVWDEIESLFIIIINIQ